MFGGCIPAFGDVDASAHQGTLREAFALGQPLIDVYFVEKGSSSGEMEGQVRDEDDQWPAPALGKPTDNGFSEAFYSKLRSECLNAHWFLTLADSREKLETWRRYYNEERSSLGDRI